MRTVFDHFVDGPASIWQQVQTGTGSLQTGASTLRLVNRTQHAGGYSNAQIDDYRHLARSRFRWRPPLTLTVRARFSHDRLTGTAGFGFWNEPFLTVGARLPALPQAAWFFYASQPSDMALALDVPGWGWKAAVLDASRWPFPVVLPLLPFGIPLFRSPSLHRRLWPAVQRLMGVAEAPVSHSMAEWRTYHLEWSADTVRFTVDGDLVLASRCSPRGSMGLVIWLDNRFMVATPQGRLHWGLLANPDDQWLELDWVSIEAP